MANRRSDRSWGDCGRLGYLTPCRRRSKTRLEALCPMKRPNTALGFGGFPTVQRSPVSMVFRDVGKGPKTLVFFSPNAQEPRFRMAHIESCRRRSQGLDFLRREDRGIEIGAKLRGGVRLLRTAASHSVACRKLASAQDTDPRVGDEGLDYREAVALPPLGRCRGFPRGQSHRAGTPSLTKNSTSDWVCASVKGPP